METTYDDGMYVNDNVIYFVKDQKVLMLVKDTFYKTTTSYMFQPKKIEGLYKSMIVWFDDIYESSKWW